MIIALHEYKDGIGFVLAGSADSIRTKAKVWVKLTRRFGYDFHKFDAQRQYDSKYGYYVDARRNESKLVYEIYKHLDTIDE